jgi:hypothetical protein
MRSEDVEWGGFGRIWRNSKIQDPIKFNATHILYHYGHINGNIDYWAIYLTTSKLLETPKPRSQTLLQPQQYLKLGI